jgi:hypothetical protein
MASIVLEGACHCKAIQFRVDIERSQREVLDCNCSICTKKGFLHLIVKNDQLTLTNGHDHVITYTFGTRIAKHMFCSVCGIHPFYRPRSHPDSWDVNARCLNVPLSHWTIKPFDGANWEDNVELIR